MHLICFDDNYDVISKNNQAGFPWDIPLATYINSYIMSVYCEDQLLDQQPTIQEISKHAETAKWNKLGVKLELNNENLAECKDCTGMYQIWLQEKAEKETRRKLLEALTDIRQNEVARKYKVYLEQVST